MHDAAFGFFSRKCQIRVKWSYGFDKKPVDEPPAQQECFNKGYYQKNF